MPQELNAANIAAALGVTTGDLQAAFGLVALRKKESAVRAALQAAREQDAERSAQEARDLETTRRPRRQRIADMELAIHEMSEGRDVDVAALLQAPEGAA